MSSSESMAASISKPESQPESNPAALVAEVECAKCACCGLTEECTPKYIAKVKERYQGRWVCGLCSEAVKEEMIESEESSEEAVNRHMSFCKKFRASTPPVNSSGLLLSAMRQIVRRGLDSPRALQSSPNSPRGNEDDVRDQRSIVRSESCFSSFAR